MKELSEFRVQYGKNQETIQELCQLLKISQPQQLVSQLDRKMKEAVKKELSEATRKVDQLTKELEEKREELDQQKKFTKTASKNLQAIREFIGNPGEVINKAMLFDEKVMETGKQIPANLMMALVSYHRKMEAIVEPLREVMKEVEERREREQGPETETGTRTSTPSGTAEEVQAKDKVEDVPSSSIRSEPKGEMTSLLGEVTDIALNAAEAVEGC